MNDGDEWNGAGGARPMDQFRGISEARAEAPSQPRIGHLVYWISFVASCGYGIDPCRRNDRIWGG